MFHFTGHFGESWKQSKDLRYITTCEKACTGPYKITFKENGSTDAYMNAGFIGNEQVWLNHWLDLQDMYVHTHRNDPKVLTFIVPFSLNCSLPSFN